MRILPVEVTVISLLFLESLCSSVINNESEEISLLDDDDEDCSEAEDDYGIEDDSYSLDDIGDKTKPFSVAPVGKNSSVEAEPRWLGDTLQDIDSALSLLLSQPVNEQRIEFVYNFVHGYKGLMERLVKAALARDPRTIEVFRELKSKGGHPSFTSLLSELSIQQKEFHWTSAEIDVLRTDIVKINRLVDQFKQAVIYLLQN